MTTKVIDTPTKLTAAQIATLRANGVECVIRYYTRNASSWKLLKADEANRITAAGLQLAAVYQDRQTKPEDFGLINGRRAGTTAHRYATQVIGQPAGSAIYFSVDGDIVPAKTVRDVVIPFFQGIRESLVAEGGGEAEFKVGVYGSGLVCSTILDAGLAEFAWLPGAMGWSGSRVFKESKRWNLFQRVPPTSLGGIDLDENDVNDEKPDFGQFTLGDQLSPLIAPPGRPTAIGNRYQVIARSGLRLRGGPGEQFDVIRLLPAGTVVVGLSEQSGWTLVDLEGDGLADGWMSAGFLSRL